MGGSPKTFITPEDTTPGIALVPVGGYGRAELCPQSDIDVMLVHDRRVDVTAIAERVWYPVWDQELHLGHSVCTVRDALALGADDLDTATSLLSARLVAGDPGPAATWPPVRPVDGGNARPRCCGRSPTASSSGTRKRATSRSVRSRI